MTQRPKTFPEDLELYYFHIVHNHASTFKCFFGCYICYMGLQIIITYVPSKNTTFRNSFKNMHCEKCKITRIYENVGTIHINVFKTCAALQNLVKAMHTGHLQPYFPYFLLYYSQNRFKNY